MWTARIARHAARMRKRNAAEQLLKMNVKARLSRADPAARPELWEVLRQKKQEAERRLPPKSIDKRQQELFTT